MLRETSSNGVSRIGCTECLWVLILCLLLFIIGCATPYHPLEAMPEKPGPLKAAGAGTSQNAEYALQLGDELEVKFFYYPELNQQHKIGPDGKISLPFVGEIDAQGQTISGLRRNLVTHYNKHLRFPELVVILQSAVSYRIYVGGEVFNPAIFPLTGRMTTLQAIFMAGGFKKTAKMDNVVILRDQGTETPLFMKIDLSQNFESPQKDVTLSPQDIVFVPKTTIAKLNDFVEQYIDKVIPFQRALSVTYEINQFKY